MKLILHIGAERTGSTSLQNYFNSNYEYFLRRGIVYLKSDKINSIGLALSFSPNKYFEFYNSFRVESVTEINRLSSKYREKIESQFKSMKSRNDIDCAIISSEHFSSRLSSLDSIFELKMFLETLTKDIQVVYFSREEKSFKRSLYSVALKSGYSIDYKSFLKEIGRDERYFPENGIPAIWESVFGDKFVTMKYELIKGGDNISESIVNLSGKKFKLPPIVKVNSSLNRNQKIYLRFVNILFPNYKALGGLSRHSFIGNILRRPIFYNIFRK